MAGTSATLSNGQTPSDQHKRHALFTAWARSRGVQILGVEAAVLPGRGVGLVTTERIQKGRRILHIPNNAMLRPSHMRRAVPEASAQAQLTMEALHEVGKPGSEMRVWEATWPTREELRACMPLQWNRFLQQMLPASAACILAQQIQDFERDFACLPRDMRDHTTRDEFMYFWCIMNSRSFHFKPPGSRPGFTVMCPFMDYMNHEASGRGVQVAQTAKGYDAVADRDYAPGEEILATYGSHSNDKLLVHYGFILSTATDDSISLDEILLPALPQAVRDKLDAAGYSGSYALASETGEICFKTQVAVRATFQNDREWAFFCSRGEDPGGRDRSPDVRAFLTPLLETLYEQAQTRLEELTQRTTGQVDDECCDREKDAVALELLRTRWAQIRDAVRRYLHPSAEDLDP